METPNIDNAITNLMLKDKEGYLLAGEMQQELNIVSAELSTLKSELEKARAELASLRSEVGDRKYPCANCGVLRSESEGGKIFTVCDKCWDLTPQKGA